MDGSGSFIRTHVAWFLGVLLVAVAAPAAPAKPGASKSYGAAPQLPAQLASSRPRRLFASRSTTPTCVS